MYTFIYICIYTIVSSDYEWFTTPFNVHGKGLYVYSKFVIFVVIYICAIVYAMLDFCYVRIVIHCLVSLHYTYKRLAMDHL